MSFFDTSRLSKFDNPSFGLVSFWCGFDCCRREGTGRHDNFNIDKWIWSACQPRNIFTCHTLGIGVSRRIYWSLQLLLSQLQFVHVESPPHENASSLQLVLFTSQNYGYYSYVWYHTTGVCDFCSMVGIIWVGPVLSPEGPLQKFFGMPEGTLRPEGTKWAQGHKNYMIKLYGWIFNTN